MGFLRVWVGGALFLILSISQGKAQGPQDAGQAERRLREAIAAGKGTAELHGELGALLYRAGRFGEAVPELGRAAQLAPDSADYNLRLAGALIGDRQYPVAVQFLLAVKSRFDSRAEFHYNLGLAYYGLRNYPAALSSFQKALQLDPRLHAALFFVGNCHAVTGDLPAATRFYRKALDLDAKNAAYCLAIGKVLGQMGSQYYTESLAWLRKTLALKPGDTAATFALGLQCETMGDLACARVSLEAVTTRFPDELAAHVALTRVYAQLKDQDGVARERSVVERLRELQRTQPQRSAPAFETESAPAVPRK